MNKQKWMYNQVVFTIAMVVVVSFLLSSGLWAAKQIDFYSANAGGFSGQLNQMGKDAGAVWNSTNEQYGTFPLGEVENDAVGSAKLDFIANETILCEAGYVTFTILSSEAIWSISWIFEGGIPSTSTSPNPTVYYGTPGTYDVTLVVTNKGGTHTLTKCDYITVLPADEIAEAVDYEDVCQPFIKSGDADWYRDTGVYFNDNDSARSGDIDDDQSTTIETTVTLDSNGVVKFYWKVSSEANYDYLRFYIDGMEKAWITGVVNWTQLISNITAGTHTLKWSYIKDVSVSSGSDCGWVDKLEI